MKVELDLLTKSIHLSDIDSIFFHLEKYNTHLINMDNTFNLGIYSKEHKDLMNFANSQGVFYKSSGAGSGDIGILLSKDKSKINNFCDHLSGMNIHFFDL